jgi:hypothetical protein
MIVCLFNFKELKSNKSIECNHSMKELSSITKYCASLDNEWLNENLELDNSDCEFQQSWAEEPAHWKKNLNFFHAAHHLKRPPQKTSNLSHCSKLKETGEEILSKYRKRRRGEYVEVLGGSNPRKNWMRSNVIQPAQHTTLNVRLENLSTFLISASWRKNKRNTSEVS